MAEFSHNIDEEAAFVNTILLWRIYDALILLLTLQSREQALSLTALHESGEFLGPNPSYRPGPFNAVAEQDEPGK